MKLRIQGNSVRFRLNRKDVENLRVHGTLQDRLVITNERGWTYGLYRTDHPQLTLSGTGCDLLVGVPAPDMLHWLETDLTGLYGDIEGAVGGRLTVSIEKDFACLGVPGEERDPDAFPHPEPQTTC